MWGTRVETTWEIGSPVTWNGEHDGKAYQDRGEVLAYDEPHVLSVTHYSPLMGQPDEPKNYHTLVYTLAADGDRTHVRLTQDGCDDEAQAEQFSANWQQMLDSLKATSRGSRNTACGRLKDCHLASHKRIGVRDRYGIRTPMVLRDGGQAAGGCTGRRSRSANTRFATKIAFNAFGKPQ